MPLEKTKIDREKKVMELMIGIFCSRMHHVNPGLCTDCRKLLDYTYKRLDKCPFGSQKSACRKCPIHCYEKEMREKIRQVMRFSGPRMLFYHPLIAVQHYLDK